MKLLGTPAREGIAFFIVVAIVANLLISGGALVLYGFFEFVLCAYWLNTYGLAILAVATGLAVRLRSKTSASVGTSFAWLMVAVMLAGVRVYATHIEPRMIKVREVTIYSRKISEPLRILHISDIQSPEMGEYEVEMFRIMRELNPDMLLNTGDLLQTQPPIDSRNEMPKLEALFESIPAPLGRFNVLGDTDWRANKRLFASEKAIRTLVSEDGYVNTPGGRVRLIGLTLEASRYPHITQLRIKEIAATLRDDEFTIMMGHAPDYAMLAQALPIDLCLAGHTHGGQIRIPFFGPPVTFSKVPREWARGFRAVGKTHLNVSAGLGAEHHGGLPSIRVNCPPEMTLITILPEKPTR